MSLLFASGILAIGGLGLFMLKREETETDEKQVDYSTLFNWSFDDKEADKTQDIENKDETLDDTAFLYEPEQKKPRRRTKTHRNRQNSSRQY